MAEVVNITVAGLGGQGVLKVTDILAEAIFNAGFDVKKSEVHGMSQRGGSVSSEVRYGATVHSPMVPDGESDFLLILEEEQLQVNIAKLKKDGILITPALLPIDKLENPKSVNIMFLGALSVHLDLPEHFLLEAVKHSLPEKLHAVNLAAFELGKNYQNQST